MPMHTPTMLNHRLDGYKLRIFFGVALGTLMNVPAFGQDCQLDSDCGQGFQCIHDAAGTSSVTGAGGSSMPQCGDGICEGASEDIESCPEDCDTIQYCAPAECSSDGDCAEGYECGPELGANSSSSSGGTSGSVCGDSICASDESNDSCPDDCFVYRLCQMAQVMCTLDSDCAAGFYCYRVESSSNVAASVDSAASSDTATDGSDGSSATSDGGDVTTGGDSGGGDEVGICLPTITETTDGSSNVATVGGDTGGSTTSAGEASGGAASNDSAASAASDGAGGTASGDSGNASSATGGGGSSDSDDDADSGDDAGCSCGVVGSQSRSDGVLAPLLLSVMLAFARRKKTVARQRL